MIRKLARTGVAAIALASAAISLAGLPAQAGTRYAANTEYQWTYYSNAAHTTEVGYWYYGCAGTYTGGTRTVYYTETTYNCNTGPGPNPGPGIRPASKAPRIAPNTEYVTTYYSSASHSTEIGLYEFGCAGTYQWGTKTSYWSDSTYECNP